MTPFNCLIVFLAAFVIDVLWVLLVLSIEKKRVVSAMLTSVFMAVCSLNAYLEVASNRWLQIPYYFGIGCGTWFGIWLGSRFFRKEHDTTKD